MLLIREFIWVVRFVGLHQVAEFVFVQGFLICRETLHDTDKGGPEAGFCFFVIFGVDWTFEEVYYEVGCTIDGDLAIGFEVEQEGPENLEG